MSAGSQVLAGVVAGALALAGTLGTAQQTPDGPSESASASVIEGFVRNAVTGMPIGKVRITLRSAGAGRELSYSSETNTLGHFLVADVETGSYWLQFQKRGLLDQEGDTCGLGRSSRFFSVSPGQHVRDILVPVLPCSVIAGRVLTEDGDPIAGAEVQAMRWPQERQQPGALSARTNDLGQYRIYWLTPGTYYLSASYDNAEDSEDLEGGAEQSESESNENYVRTFYSGATDLAGATPIFVAAGGENGSIDIPLLKKPGKLIASLNLSVATDENTKTREPQDADLLQHTSAQDRKAAVIEGDVVNRVTTVPLQGVHLILRRGDAGLDVPYVADSDARGHFRMNKVEPGLYRLWASGKGLQEQEYGNEGQDPTGKVIKILAGQHVQDLLFRVTPPAVITGKLLDVDGEPIVRADVEAMRVGYQDGKRQLQVATVAVTNDLGEFRLYGLEPGKYHVATSPEPTGEENTPQSSAGRWRARTFFPHTTDSSAATPISVDAGEEIGGIDLCPVVTRGVRIEGQVLNAAATRTVTVTLISRDSGRLAFSSGNTTGVDSVGHFVLEGILPGSYFLSVNGWNGHEQYYAGQMMDVANSDIDNLRLVLAKPVTLIGQVQIEEMRGRGIGNLHVILESESAIATGLGADVKPDGRFVVTDAPPFKYTLSVVGLEDSWYMKSLDLGGETLPDFTLDMARVGGGPITVHLSPLGGTIHGRVMDETKLPAKGALVVLVPDRFRSQQTQLYKTATTDSSGHFMLAGIAPGSYELFAWRKIEGDAYRDPEFVQQFENLGKEVMVMESMNQQWNNEDIVLTLISISDEQLR